MTSEQLRSELAALHPACHGWALACCRRDPEEAAETLQTAYLRILDGRARFGERSSLKTWVFGVIRVTARERSMQRTRRELRERAASAGEASAAWASEPDGAAELLVALARLSSRQREVLELVFYHDLTIEGAAGVMGIGLGTARTHYERGKHRLRELLAPSSRTP